MMIPFPPYPCISSKKLSYIVEITSLDMHTKVFKEGQVSDTSMTPKIKYSCFLVIDQPAH
ncbi:hypothetical protein ACB092_08G095900 [Castanea dentata]